VTDKFVTLSDEEIAQIHQAFDEAGYIHFTNVTSDPHWMSGQEWYDRFVKNIGALRERSHKGYLEAAKRAAGLDTEGGKG
jgi:hypothetical protein